MDITFWGAARTVTGSQHLVTASGQRLLLDCGLYQGRRDDAYRINQKLPYQAGTVDAMVLSHAHIDHTGNIPNLVKSGFKGRIHATSATCDLADSMLRDSGRIQEDDVYFINKRLRPGEARREPIYTEEDAARALTHFVAQDYGKSYSPIDSAQVTFSDAGHMLGSTWELLTLREGGREIRLCFSGDLGRVGLPILRDPAPMPECDYLILESTYGDRTHPPIADALPELERAVKDVIARRGKLIIPSFAVGRSQEIVYCLNELIGAGRIPGIPVYVDSPLAVNVTKAFREHPECYDAETAAIATRDADGDPFGFKRLTYVREAAESKKLNDMDGPLIVISASGMCENGRILHHLRHGIGDTRNTILFVSFQAPNTLGRKILDGMPYVRILGDEFRVAADIRRIEAFSGHADRNDLLGWVKPRIKGLRKIFLVHGEIDPMKALAESLTDAGARSVEMPVRGETKVLE